MSPRKLFICLIAALAALAAPTAAQAACDPASVTVTAAKSAAQVGQQVNFSYELCFKSQPERFDVQVLRITVTADGDIASQTPVTAAAGQSISGRTSPITGSGAHTAQSAGDYLVRVRYYAAGKTAAEAIGEATWHVEPAREQTSTPPTPTVPAVPAPEPQRAAPVQPLIAPQPAPQGAPQQAKLKLTKRAARRTVRPGKNARFTLTVKNTSRVAAIGVTVCDRIPSGTQYVTASRKVTFKGAQACVKVGTLKAGATAAFTVTLRVDRTRKAGKVINRAAATASNAATVKAAASVRVPKVATPRVRARVTG